MNRVVRDVRMDTTRYSVCSCRRFCREVYYLWCRRDRVLRQVLNPPGCYWHPQVLPGRRTREGTVHLAQLVPGTRVHVCRLGCSEVGRAGLTEEVGGHW